MTTQRRMTRENRRAQLVEVALGIVASDGADGLTLGRLAESAGVSKPVVYDHFESRAAVLLSLYRDFDRRQTDKLLAELAHAPVTREARVAAIARCHVECVVEHGVELAGIADALSGSPEMAEVRRGSERDYLDLCRRAIDEAAGRPVLDEPSAVAFLGAADALGVAAADGAVDAVEAERTLGRLLLSLTTDGEHDRTSARDL
jgi:AcrR family transcriptional regulator